MKVDLLKPDDDYQNVDALGEVYVAVQSQAKRLAFSMQNLLDLLANATFVRDIRYGFHFELSETAIKAFDKRGLKINESATLCGLPVKRGPFEPGSGENIRLVYDLKQ